MTNDPIFSEDEIKSIFHAEKNGITSDIETSIPIRASIPEQQAINPIPQNVIRPNLAQIKTSTYKENGQAGQVNIARPENFGKIFLKFLSTFLALFAISFTIINAPALLQKFKYFWEVEYSNNQWNKSFTTNNISPTTIQESRIIIPKINVNAPIVWDVSAEKMLDALERGVAHYETTAMPGQIGNIFISGHSSYYVWAPGDYKDVFALLDKLEGGDKIYITYQGIVYTYEVSDRIVVAPDNLEVLSQGNEKTLSLMTCVPIGTNLKRLVVTAKEIK